MHKLQIVFSHINCCIFFPTIRHYILTRFCVSLRMLTQPHDVRPARWSHRLAAERWMRVLAARRDAQSVRFQPTEAARLQALPIHCGVNSLLHAVPVAAIHDRRFALRGQRVLQTLHDFAQLTGRPAASVRSNCVT